MCELYNAISYCHSLSSIEMNDYEAQPEKRIRENERLLHEMEIPQVRNQLRSLTYKPNMQF